MPSSTRRTPVVVGLTVAALLGLYLTSQYSFLLFHSLAEVFSIIVAVGIFMIAWNTRQWTENDYLVFLGVAYLFVAGLDFLHTLAYKGMGVFPGAGANLPTQLWIASRYVESLSLLIAPLFLRRRTKAYTLFFGYATVTACFVASIFVWDIFPPCFVEPTGLTAFKKVSEYLIAALLLGAIGVLYTHRTHVDGELFTLVVASIGITIAAELAFTFYVSVYGLSNVVGHVLKIISFALIYKGIIESSLQKPYGVLFRNLQTSEATLREEKAYLEEALAQLKTLRGLLPICAGCKKIRDDNGYWEQIERYISQRSDAQFSHGICPECTKQLYPELSGSVYGHGKDGPSGT